MQKFSCLNQSLESPCACRNRQIQKVMCLLLRQGACLDMSIHFQTCKVRQGGCYSQGLYLTRSSPSPFLHSIFAILVVKWGYKPTIGKARCQNVYFIYLEYFYSALLLYKQLNLHCLVLLPYQVTNSCLICCPLSSPSSFSFTDLSIPLNIRFLVYFLLHALVLISAS